MVATLIYSEKCTFCLEILTFLKSNPVLVPFLKPHDINIHGVPQGLKKVPALVQENGNTLIGIEVLRWLENMVPVNFEGNSREVGSVFDEPWDGVGDSFPLDNYGISLSPNMTKELEEKIAKPVMDSYAKQSKT